jgi:hypothetical protein
MRQNESRPATGAANAAEVRVTRTPDETAYLDRLEALLPDVAQLLDRAQRQLQVAAALLVIAAAALTSAVLAVIL